MKTRYKSKYRNAKSLISFLLSDFKEIGISIQCSDYCYTNYFTILEPILKYFYKFQGQYL